MIDLFSVEGVIVMEGGIKMFVACSRPKFSKLYTLNKIQT